MEDGTASSVVVKAKQPYLKRGQGVQRRLQYAAEGKQYVPKGGFVYNTGLEDDPDNRPSKTFLFKLAKLNTTRPKEPQPSSQPARTRPSTKITTAAPPKHKPALHVCTFTRLDQQRTITAAAVPEDFDRAVLHEVVNHSQQRASTGRRPVGTNKAAAPTQAATDSKQDEPTDPPTQLAEALCNDTRLAAAELQRLRAELDKDRATLRADRALFEKHKADAEASAAARLTEQQSLLQQERKRVERRAMEVERRAVALTRLPSRKERAEIEALTKQLEQERTAARSQAAKQQLTISRLRQQLSKAQAAQRELMEEVRWYEAKQLDGWARAHRRAGTNRAAPVAAEEEQQPQVDDPAEQDACENAAEQHNTPGDDALHAVAQGLLKGPAAAAVVAAAGMTWSPAVVPMQQQQQRPCYAPPLLPAAWQPLACPPLPSLPWHAPLVHQACCNVSDAVDRFRAGCQP